MHIRGVELAMRDSGAGRLLVWGHGMMSSMADEDGKAPSRWSAAIEGVRLLRYDARGHGASEASADPAGYTWDALGRDMLALGECAGGGQPFIAGGWSMGCASALHAACHAPGAVQGLILLQAPRAWEARRGPAQVYRRALRLSHLMEDGHPCRARLFEAASVSDLPPRERLIKLDVPALVIAVAGEPEHPLAAALELQQLLPRSRLLEAGQPDDPRIGAAIREFATGLARCKA